MDEKLDQIARDVINVAFEVHKTLGPGLLERVYRPVMTKKLIQLGYTVECEKSMNIVYDGFIFKEAFRADLVVERCLIIELKSVETLLPLHFKQLLTYLRLTDTRLGRLINFGAAMLKDGIRRIAN